MITWFTNEEIVDGLSEKSNGCVATGALSSKQIQVNA